MVTKKDWINLKENNLGNYINDILNQRKEKAIDEIVKYCLHLEKDEKYKGLDALLDVFKYDSENMLYKILKQILDEIRN